MNKKSESLQPKDIQDLSSNKTSFTSNIDSKLDSKTFYWAMGVIVIVFCSMFWLIMCYYEPKVSGFSDRLIRLETIIDLKIKK